MAKGDHQRMETSIQDERSRFRGQQDDANRRINRNDDRFYNDYTRSSDRDFGAFNNIMSGYQDFYNNPWGGGRRGGGYDSSGNPMGGGYGGRSGNASPDQNTERWGGGSNMPPGNDAPQFYGGMLGGGAKRNLMGDGGGLGGMRGNQGRIMGPGGEGFQRNNQAPDESGKALEDRAGYRGGPGGGANRPAANNQDWGNTADPNTWMGIASDPNKSQQWLKSQFPDLPDDVAKYYAGVIKGQPGANATEQAGSAQYYANMIREREYNGNKYVGSAAKGGGGGGGDYGWDNPAQGKAYGGYSDFANNGGYSDTDVQDIRNRALSPIRSIYSSAQSGLERSRGLNPYSPNYAAASSQMARNMSNQIGDMNENVQGDVAQMRNEGRRFGISGLAGMGEGEAGRNLGRDTAGMGARLGALGGMSGLYGTSPGASGLQGGLLGNNTNSLLQSLGLGGQFGQGNNNAYGNLSQVPGNFQSAMGNIGSVLNMAAPFIPGGQMGGLFGRGSGNQRRSIYGGGNPYGYSA